MRLLGRNRLQPLLDTGSLVRKWTLSWVAEVRDAQWTCAAHVVNQFPNLSQENNIFVFPVTSCTTSVVVLLEFPQQIALITALRAA
jgi:mRNA-degrading endonuclease HigB of HigAB toxin-antitoxin module